MATNSIKILMFSFVVNHSDFVGNSVFHRKQFAACVCFIDRLIE